MQIKMPSLQRKLSVFSDNFYVKHRRPALFVSSKLRKQRNRSTSRRKQEDIFLKKKKRKYFCEKQDQDMIKHFSTVNSNNGFRDKKNHHR